MVARKAWSRLALQATVKGADLDCGKEYFRSTLSTRRGRPLRNRRALVGVTTHEDLRFSDGREVPVPIVLAKDPRNFRPFP
jgi:hypothetical protein